MKTKYIKHISSKSIQIMEAELYFNNVKFVICNKYSNEIINIYFKMDYIHLS